MNSPKFIGRLALRLANCLRTSAARLSRPLDHVQLALVIPLEGDARDQAVRTQIEILRKLGHNPGLDAPPHITLKLGFSAADTAPFEQYLAQLAAEIPRFDIFIKNFGFFDEGILFLDIEPNPSLENLRQRILADLNRLHGIQKHPIEGDAFHFHVTLAHGLSNREFRELRKTYGERSVQIAFKARHIDLFCHTGQQWITLKHASLKSSPNLP